MEVHMISISGAKMAVESNESTKHWSIVGIWCHDSTLISLVAVMQIDRLFWGLECTRLSRKRYIYTIYEQTSDPKCLTTSLQDDKDLVHEFVVAEGLTCLIKVGAEADQNYQNYILRGNALPYISIIVHWLLDACCQLLLASALWV